MSLSPVLLTGGAGYIGSHILLELQALGRDAVVIDDLSAGYREAIPAGVALHQGDIADQDFVASILDKYRVRTVIHLAGSISVPESMTEPVTYYRNNAFGSLRLGQVCADRGVENFLLSSTGSVYGNVGDGLATETTPTAPISPYARSKLMAETMLRDIAAVQTGFRFAAIRYFNVAGADPAGRTGQRNPQGTGLILGAIYTALGRRPVLDIFGDDFDTRDGSVERDYIHVSDLASAHIATLDVLERGGDPGVLNLGYGRGFTVLEVVSALEAMVGHEIAKRQAGRRPGDMARVVANADRARALLDWQPRYDNLDTILQTALDWHRSRP